MSDQQVDMSLYDIPEDNHLVQLVIVDNSNIDPDNGVNLSTMNKRQLKYYYQLKEVCKKRGGKLMSRYERNKDPLEVDCGNGHIMSKTPHSLKNGTWCIVCPSNVWKKSREDFYKIVFDKGGTRLGEYVRAQARVKIRCRAGHVFNTKPMYVKSGNWCPECSGKSPKQAAKKVQGIIESRGGQLLSPYKNTETPVKIECELGHIWNTRPHNIVSGNWCPKCSGRCVEQAKEDTARAVSNMGGVILSNYIDQLTKIQIRCGNGHMFWKRPAPIKRGGWCRKCSDTDPEKAYERLCRNVAGMGGIMISEYLGNSKKVHIDCGKGHDFWTVPYSINAKHWCPKCANKCPEQSEERFLEKVKGNEGSCMDVYQGDRVKVRIQCQMKHVFCMEPHEVKSGRWCPTCKESKGERACRHYLERNNIPFESEYSMPSALPEFIAGPNRYRYDFYIPSTKTLIEYDGKQHFEFVKYFHRTIRGYQKRQEADQIKTCQGTCNGYRLIRIDYTCLDKIDTLLDKYLQCDDVLCLSTPSMYEYLEYAK